jgi:hypothetical protein
MTLTVDAFARTAHQAGGHSSVIGTGVSSNPERSLAKHPVVIFDPRRFVTLLEDPELSQWAKEAGVKYQLTDLEALWLLAQALLLDRTGPENGQI